MDSLLVWLLVVPAAFGGLAAWLPWSAFAAAVATTLVASAVVLAVPNGRQKRNKNQLYTIW